jgi:hypothetical protein
VLLQHQDIEDAVVVGIPDETGSLIRRRAAERLVNDNVAVTE